MRILFPAATQDLPRSAAHPFYVRLNHFCPWSAQYWTHPLVPIDVRQMAFTAACQRGLQVRITGRYRGVVGTDGVTSRRRSWIHSSVSTAKSARS